MDNVIEQWLEGEEEEELIEGVGVDSDEELETEHVEVLRFEYRTRIY